MHLFTSNSKYTFIINTMIIFLLVLLVYTILILIFPENTRGANERQNNIIRAQTFLTKAPTKEIVVVGSSMGARLPIEKTIPSSFNLSFVGGASLTGLELLQQTNQIPAIVFIETGHTILRDSDPKIITKARNASQTLPFLQEQNRPETFLPHILTTINQKRIYLTNYLRGKDIGTTSQISKNNSLSDPPLQNKALMVQENSLSDEINPIILENQITKFKSFVSFLEAQGTIVIFFDPPMHPSLFGKQRNKHIRTAFLAAFPHEKYHWFIVEWNDYNTVDGAHLGPKSADKYTNEMLNYLKKNNLSKSYN